MMRVDFQLSDEWRTKVTDEQIATADEAYLRYEFMPGDIILLADVCDFSARWGWIPILDFATCLRAIARELEQRPDATSSFEFTESTDSIFFARDKDVVTISASYVTCSAEVPISDFREAVADFLDRVASEAIKRFPAIATNQHFLRLLGQ